MTDPKKGDRYQLECGHEGRVVWINDNEDTMAVAGTRRSCRDCGKKTTGNWTPTVYLLQLNELAS
ncbi:MAG: hypothetical protein JSV76_00280 [Candidatus Bathyarchaeota archaeon]|nr:MAG: hypothetical protein JSV76_00280 [Candidatus Bathyarchaeota archaeon]